MMVLVLQHLLRTGARAPFEAGLTKLLKIDVFVVDPRVLAFASLKKRVTWKGLRFEAVLLSTDDTGILFESVRLRDRMPASSANHISSRHEVDHNL